MAEIEFITTTKGKTSITFGGHQYRIVRDIHGLVTWSCVNEQKQRCKGSNLPRDGKLVENREIPHVCSSEEAELDVKKKLDTCRKRAREDLSIPVCEIFRKEFMDLEARGYEFVNTMPNYNVAKTSLCKIKRVALGTDQNSKTGKEIVSLIPLEKVEDGWLATVAEAPESDKLRQFADYFVDQWLDNDIINIDVWNVSKQRHRTNNVVEGWHRKK